MRELDEAAGKKSVVCMTHSAEIQSTEYVAFEGGSGGVKRQSKLLTLTRALRTTRTEAVPVMSETEDGIVSVEQRCHSVTDCFISNASS